MMAQRLIPAWLRAYSPKAQLSLDLAAGLTVAVMLIPQSMAYAMLAGLPPVMGLYASVLPLVAYALIGSSRQLAVGPVAMDSLLVATGAALVASPGSAEYIAAAMLLAGMVGVLHVGMGLLRLGFIVNFLSRPVISGFTSAAAIIIGLSQLPHLLGVPLPRSTTLIDFVTVALPELTSVHLPTLAIGATGILAIVLAKRVVRRVPAGLAVVALATVVTWVFGLDERGVKVVGVIDARLPSLGLPSFDWQTVQALFPSALMIALIAFMEAISVAKAMASKHRYDVDPNRELIGLGAANLTAFMSGGYVVTGGLSRSAVNDQAGATSPLASIFTALTILATLLALTPLFRSMPNAVLASIVMVAVSSLIDAREPLRLWRVRRSDAALLVLTFLATLLLGIGLGITIGVVASLAAFIQRSTRPHTAELGRIPGTNAFRNLKNFPDARPLPGVLTLRMDASFYFGNVAHFRDRLEAFLRDAPKDVHTVLLDASSMNDLDSSAESALRETVEKLRSADKDFVLANVKGPVRQVMQRSGLWALLGEDHVYLTLEQAALGIEQLRSARGSQPNSHAAATKPNAA